MEASALTQPLTLRRHSGIVTAEQPAVIVGSFNRNVVTLRRVAMLTRYRKLVPHRFRITADLAGIGQASDRAQCKLLAPARIITGGRGFWTRVGSRIASST
jgi:hypothetical protein